MNKPETLIEQAARRLEELERAGIVVPWEAAAIGLPPPSLVAPGAVAPAPVRAPAPARPIAPAYSPPAAAYSVHLDLMRLKEMGYLVPDQLRSEIAQQFRLIKRPLLKTARGDAQPGVRRAHHIMVTSALPGEGKTFCSLNLAMSMAMEVDTGVILVDADVVRPAVFSRYGLDANELAPNGLLDYLSGSQTALHQLLVSTNVPKLTLMSTGRSNSRSSELLSSDGMERLLDTLAEQYADHVVIFDASPVLLTTESIALAGKVGQVVVVVENDKTPKAAVKKAFDALRHCPNVSTVLNKCEAASLGNRYGYYY